MSKQYQQQSIKLQLKCMSEVISPTIVKQTMEFIDEQIQAAFQRGLSAGKHLAATERNKSVLGTITEDSSPLDDIFIAVSSGVNSPDALSNLYSKEKGFKK